MNTSVHRFSVRVNKTVTRILLRSPTACAVTIVLIGLVTPVMGSEDATSDLIPRNLSFQEIDPAIYFDFDDPSDPFSQVYAGFRARRASDMANPVKPPPIQPYESVHRSVKKPWHKLDEILPFDWAGLRAESPQEALQLEHVIKSRLAFDHPDVKITQLMIGPGATLPGHAGGSPGFYYVIGGSGEVTVEGVTQSVTPGTTVKLNPYDVRRVYAYPGQPLKIIWVRWAPDGDQQYIAAGYYLTGANQHIQPKDAVLPEDFQFWGERYSTNTVSEATSPVAPMVDRSVVAAQLARLKLEREKPGESRNLYPATPVFSHEADRKWIDEEQLKGSGFFWSKDISQLGDLLYRWGEVMKLKDIQVWGTVLSGKQFKSERQAEAA